MLTPRRKLLASAPTGTPTRSALFGDPKPQPVKPSKRRGSSSDSDNSDKDVTVTPSLSTTSARRPPPVAGIPAFTGSFVEADDNLDNPAMHELVGGSLATSLAIIRATGVLGSRAHSPANRRVYPDVTPTPAEVDALSQTHSMRKQARHNDDTRRMRSIAAQGAPLCLRMPLHMLLWRVTSLEHGCLFGPALLLFAGLQAGVVPTSPTVAAQDAGVLTPFKLIESRKEAQLQHRSAPSDVEAASWGSSPPSPQRLAARRGAVAQ